MSLSAPTAGTYQGILFFQDPGNTTTALIVGWNSDSTFVQGAYYFPTALVEIASAGAVSYNPIVAYTILFYDTTYGGQNFNNTNVYSNYSSLSEGSPVKGGGVLAE